MQMKNIHLIPLVLCTIAITLFTSCNHQNPTTKSIEHQWIGIKDTIPNTMFDISITKPGYMIIAKQNQPLAEALNLLQDTYFYIEGTEIPIQILPHDDTSGHIVATMQDNTFITIPYHSFGDSKMVLQYNGDNLELKVSPKVQTLVSFGSGQ